MKKTAILVLCTLSGFAATAQTSVGEAGANAGTAPAPAAQDFVQKAAISDMFEIQSSQIAEQKGDDKAKDFARHMIADHKKTTAQLEGLIKSGKVSARPPTALDETHQSKLALLQRQDGSDFTKAYYDTQLSAHKEAVSLFERYAKDGDNPQLKAWAGKTLPTLQDHLKMAQALER